ncbi:MAG: alpha/beta hydrolase [Bacilli bacterium]|jgi:pimeloyl-ACP methyl ester carboxylesterase
MQKYVEIEVKGKTLRGFIHEPENGWNKLVAMFHGFTGHKNENAYMFRTLSRELEKRGVASVRFDFSGSGDSDGEFSDMTYFTELEEAVAIMKWAKTLKEDIELIGLGFSLGGAVLAQASLRVKELLKQIILISPAGSIKNSFRNLCEKKPKVGEDFVDMGGYLMSTAVLSTIQDFDLYQNLENFDKPVFIIHGEADQAVPVEYGKRYSEIYPKADMVIIPEAPHGYSTIEMREELYEHIIRNILREEGDQ